MKLSIKHQFKFRVGTEIVIDLILESFKTYLIKLLYIFCSYIIKRNYKWNTHKTPSFSTEVRSSFTLGPFSH